MSNEVWFKFFRRAKPATALWNVSKTLLHTAAFWTVFLWLLPVGIVWAEQQFGMPQWQVAGMGWFAWPAFALLGTLGIASGVTMAIQGAGTPLPLDGPRRLVVAGPYRFVRNPMAVAGLGQGAMVGLYFGSISIFLYVLAGGLIWNYWVRPIEEDHLLEIFGQPFAHYQQHVRCWLPRLRPYDSSVGVN